MDVELRIYYGLLLSTIVLSVIIWKKFQPADRVIAILIIITLIAELCARFASYEWGNNLPVYHVYTPIEFFLISLYFNYSINAFRKRNIGIIVGIFGVVLSIINSLYIQEITTIDSYFLLFEGTAIIVFSLLSFHQILMDEDHLPYRFANFWITICFILYWSATFTGWGIYNVLDPTEFVLNPIFRKVLTAANYVFYFGLSLVFLFYKKLIPSGT